MQVPQIVGADISKKSIDLFINSKGVHCKIENSAEGFKTLLKWFRLHELNNEELIIVMEHTGLYSFAFENFLHLKKIKLAKVPARQIQLSIGLTRGKTDKVDAKRIGWYGKQNLESLQIRKQSNALIARLRLLLTTRQNLVKQRAAAIVFLKEMNFCCQLKKTDAIVVSMSKVIKTLNEEIKKLDRHIEVLINEEKSFAINCGLLQSIPGVGKVLASHMIVVTENFTRFANARKLACYCGTAPFENSSGTSIRKGTRVSQLADKKMKTLLDLGAKAAIQHDPEIKEYYQRRIESGKPKMSSINVVRNKLLYRMFAVIKKQQSYKLAA